MKKFDVVIIGAGAAGLMCAIEAGKRGRQVLLLDNAKKAGRKILISGGGRCNFTNYYIEPSAYLSANPHFVKSALSRYTQWDFIALMDQHGVAYHEKTLGQLFCGAAPGEGKAQDLLDVLLTETQQAQADMQLRTEILQVDKTDTGFMLNTSQGELCCDSLVVATGGLSMPKLGATPYGYQLAQQFGIDVLPTSAALVPFTLHQEDKQRFAELSGVSLPVIVTAEDGTSFKENMLFTHRGLSGPAILQISSFWQPGQSISINLLPEHDVTDILLSMRAASENQHLRTALSRLLPKRLVEVLAPELPDKSLKQLHEKDLGFLADYFSQWQIKPNGTEGYRTAEVTMGGVNTDEISSKTMAAKKVPGLYFIGEVVDVTGWLGGYNFQWAWSSGWAAGQVA